MSLEPSGPPGSTFVATDLHKVLKALFKQHGQNEIRLEQAKLILCYTFRWFDPGQAEQVLRSARKRGLLRKKGPTLSLTTELDQIEIAPDFTPRFENLMTDLPDQKGQTEPLTEEEEEGKNGPVLQTSPVASSAQPSDTNVGAVEEELKKDPLDSPPSDRPRDRTAPMSKKPKKGAKTGTTSEATPFTTLLAKLEAETDLSRRQIMQQLNRSQRRHRITDIEVEALLLGTSSGVRLDLEFQQVRELLMARYAGVD